ncbi:hypothetical protein NX029_23005 [Cytobacillus firmus]|uniref:hypothetical protein n=1 Tax=Cytobacillus TaxID=2675230 RepID=UPI001C24D18A|nr:hypothetical protein [Cytobacillus oceanisediminis]MBU8771456.1 hypothetical protein [Cytobacillus oceanisediminis]MCS0826806.1 hypothetical protein [Cytobacillus firmus]
MKNLILAGALALGLIGAGASFTGNLEAGIPSEHSIGKPVELAGIPSEHSIKPIELAGIPSEHSLGIPSEH